MTTTETSGRSETPATTATDGAGASEVARRVLRQRLDRVWSRLAQAAAGTPSVRAVHRLRVDVRRAVTATELFADWFPKRGTRKLQRRLRRLRRAAGDARDLDVLGNRLAKELRRTPSGTLFRGLQAVHAARGRAQGSIAEARRIARKRSWKRKSRRWLQKAGWRGSDPEPALGYWLRDRLQGMAEEFFDAAEELGDVASIHRLRIRGKRLRYAWEVMQQASFGDAAAAAPAFGKLQKRLGRINDHATALHLFAAWSDDAKGKRGAALRRLKRREEKRLKRRAVRFRRWWSPDRAAALRAQLAEGLAGLPSIASGVAVGSRSGAPMRVKLGSRPVDHEEC